MTASFKLAEAPVTSALGSGDTRLIEDVDRDGSSRAGGNQMHGVSKHQFADAVVAGGPRLLSPGSVYQCL